MLFFMREQIERSTIRTEHLVATLSKGRKLYKVGPYQL